MRTIKMIQNNYLLRIAAEGKREDGRKMDEFRKIEIIKNPIGKAEGSARVKMGDTDVIVGVKVDIGKPFPDKQEEGVLMVSAELSPMASPDFETGPPREESIELARVVDRGIRESKTIETDKLCIEKGEKVWMVFVDLQIINHGGNLIDACALAASAALQNAKMPDFDGEKVIYEKKSKKLPVKHKPVSVTLYKFKNPDKNPGFLIDPTRSEEEFIETRITITTKDDGNVCAIQKGGIDPLTPEEIEKALELSQKRGSEIRKLI
jgi:exosome complex component RRP42